MEKYRKYVDRDKMIFLSILRNGSQKSCWTNFWMRSAIGSRGKLSMKNFPSKRKHRTRSAGILSNEFIRRLGQNWSSLEFFIPLPDFWDPPNAISKSSIYLCQKLSHRIQSQKPRQRRWWLLSAHFAQTWWSETNQKTPCNKFWSKILSRVAFFPNLFRTSNWNEPVVNIVWRQQRISFSWVVSQSHIKNKHCHQVRNCVSGFRFTLYFRYAGMTVLVVPLLNRNPPLGTHVALHHVRGWPGSARAAQHGAIWNWAAVAWICGKLAFGCKLRPTRWYILDKLS